MPKTLRQGVNEVLKKARVLDAQGELSTIVDSARQMFIDTAIQSLNEVTDDLYSGPGLSKPRQLKEDTITLAASTQSYPLHSSLVRLRTEYDLIDETNSHVIVLLEENGYWQIIRGDLEQDDTGQPSFAAQSPIDNRLVMDRTPTGTAIGRVYKYRYDRDLEFDEGCDEFPFSNMVFRAVVPAAAELWKLHNQKDFSQGLFNASLARAKNLLRRTPTRTSYRAPRGSDNVTDPMNDATVS
jgi:hypothetical protein